MNEKLLQYLWNYKVFKQFNFKDTEGNEIEILDFGQWNTNAGPDFLMAKIKVKDVIFAGNIELHVKSSDWIFHNHAQDPNYHHIILHVVYQNDADIPELKERNIPTLELKEYIDEKIFVKYQNLLKDNPFIACEEIFKPENIPIDFYDEAVLNKLEEKSLELEESLRKYKNNYEAVLFHSLAYSFGLTVNAQIFRQIAEIIDFSIIYKIRQNKNQLEALLFGISGWLENPQDQQMQLWKREFDFLKAKFNISDLKISPKFLRLRPPNFPTIRLSQLADLYHQHQNLFSKVIHAKNTDELTAVFKDVKASSYWDDHFNFGKISPVNQSKMLSKDFIELIILNTILPLKYAYEKYQKEEITDEILTFYKSLSPEKNSVTENWKKLNLKIHNALESQALIYHYKNFCSAKNCLHCSIGFKILKEA
ncbi:DUF2851 family protein [Chryseobacterium sp. GMJ5]|uniref:DUF2851 family protein n=1 Tax=Chryseobacterium gilvum TaxID=2976534 RepID=A0ABT2VYV4_9FLAO|nr:DUF2851 family protein [Chryseobacterium gilvum]MCU7614117.1 DUF2851 family protein [Chryseobacterium gilvum]